MNTDEIILETQKRVWGSLNNGYEYTGVLNDSDKFLRENVFSKLNMAVLYVDLVGSTKMSSEMSVEKIALVISSFAQEMAKSIKQYHGYVLKFVGDAVIGYFIAKEDESVAVDDAIKSAKLMISVIRKGINPILNQYGCPDLMVKVGIDFGENMVLRYGKDPEQSIVDIIGNSMNIGAKIQSMAKPNQILIGDEVYQKISPELQKEFTEKIWENHEWRYASIDTGEIYKVYNYQEYIFS